MAEGEFVQPLSGEEIIIDLCSLLADKLRKDCNLRETDSYASGYMAKVSVHLEAYGMDVAQVDAQVCTGKAQDNPDEVIIDTLEIPVEPALDLVRERSQQPVPAMASGEAQEQRPRRYQRGARVAAGGAMGEKL